MLRSIIFFIIIKDLNSSEREGGRKEIKREEEKGRKKEGREEGREIKREEGRKNFFWFMK